MSDEDQDRTKREQKDSERYRAVANTISRASSVLKETLSLDVDLADASLKYSEWMGALATAGLALTVSAFEKIHGYSWLRATQTALNLGLIATCALFLAAVGCSAVVLSLFLRLRARFHDTTLLGSAQEILLLNHIKVVAAQTEVDAVMAGRPWSLLDFVYQDIVDKKGGGLARMAYDAKDPDSARTYEEQQVAGEFGQLAESLDGFKVQFEAIEKAQQRDGRRLNRFGKAQKVLIGLGYLVLIALDFPS
jgi:hypothetical protein